MNTKALLAQSISAIVLLCFISTAFVTHPKGPSQNPPQGMVRVYSDSVVPYYISVTEEPNIHWQVYLEWIKAIYMDYPETYTDAMPKDTMTGLWQYYNDPLINHYFEHPSFQWYPVTGVSWQQVRQYLEWKTDRLNEAILDRVGAHPFIFWKQSGSENFNTEAYLVDYYEPDYRKKGKGLPKTDGRRRKIKPKDGILFPQYRLPTEQEWQLANTYLNDPGHTDIALSSLKKDNFLDWYIHYFNLDPGYKGHASHGEAGFDNFQSGVSEWLLDDETSHPYWRLSNEGILLENGWSPVKDTLSEQYLEGIKDSLGKMPFRWMGSNFLYPALDFEYSYSGQFYPNPYYKKDTAYMYSVLLPNYRAWYEERYKNTPYKPDFRAFAEPYIQNEIPYLTRDSLHGIYVRTIVKDLRNEKRKIKTGNFRKKGNATGWLPQSASSPLVGFRCVLPDQQVSVLKGYRVKW